MKGHVLYGDVIFIIESVLKIMAIPLVIRKKYGLTQS